MKTLRLSLRIASILFLASTAFSSTGCLYATYPETVDASAFEEFEYRFEGDSCEEGGCPSDSQCAFPIVCRATITREPTGDYSLRLTLLPDEQTPLTELAPRVLTDEDAQWFLELSGNLRINRHPRPFCTIPSQIGVTKEQVVRWDELEFVLLDCDRPRLSHSQVFAITIFVFGLAREPDAETP